MSGHFVDVSDYDEPSPDRQESFLGASIRNTARTASRAAEQIAGSIGDLGKAANLPVELAYAITGKDYEKRPEFLKALQHQINPLAALPGSSDIKQTVQKHTGDYLKPQGEYEQFADDVTETAAMLAGPGKFIKLGKSAIPVALKGTKIGKALAISAAANLAGTATSKITGNETAGELVKQGATIAGILKHGNTIKGLPDSLYKKAAELRGDAKINAQGLGKQARELRDEIAKGGTSSQKAAALTKLDEINKSTWQGQVPVSELEAFKKTINEIRGDLYGEFIFHTNKGAPAKARLDHVAKLIEGKIADYGKTNPEYYKTYKLADKIYGDIAQSQKFSHWIGKTFLGGNHKSLKGGIGATLIGLGLYNPAALPGLAAKAGAAYGGIKVGEYLHRIARSPELRKHYTDVMKNLIEENAQGLSKAASRFQSALTKQNPEKTSSGRFVEID